MSPGKLIVAAVLAAALAAGIVLALRSQSPAVPLHATVLEPPAALPEFDLVDHNGDGIGRSAFEGQWDLVFFGFTQCPDICPATLQVLAAAKAELEDRGQVPLPRIVLVSVDPERDTPDVMSRYVGYFGDGHLGITGELAEIRKLTDGLGIYFRKQATGADDYTVDHSAAVLAVDPAGRFSAVFGGQHVVENYLNDLPVIMEAG
ncbi:MAG: SCO family protein [Proteobacteria bacterium]|nr:SCO family protein [Pseudomonadota bacterium]